VYFSDNATLEVNKPSTASASPLLNALTKAPLTANASSPVSDSALRDVVGAAAVAAVVVGAGAGAVEAGDTGSFDELHAAMIRAMTVNGATNHNCCDQLFRL
jgi:hypothetical protein